MKAIKFEQGGDAYLDLLKKALSGFIYDESAWSVVEPGAAVRSLRQPMAYARGLVLDWFIRRIRKSSMLVVQTAPFDANVRSEGADWPLIGYTMVGQRRLDNVQACVEEVLKNEIPGDFIETGAWRGGTTIFMRALLKAYGITDRVVWVADSFEGMPVPKSASDGWDLSKVDYVKVSLEKVKSNFERFGMLDDQVKFLKGWFCETLPKAPIEKLAILRLDGDLYSSTLDALENLYSKVSRGGYVIVDDYYSWPACRQAVTDYLARNSLQPEIKAVDRDCVYWKC